MYFRSLELFPIQLKNSHCLEEKSFYLCTPNTESEAGKKGERREREAEMMGLFEGDEEEEKP
ncbi:hypothetical protein [Marivirga sp.]|uniref:hypothetical protein n=1 Tax=Marivirga sp. TaxID=2018662 RepID=UPI003DA6D35C